MEKVRRQRREVFAGKERIGRFEHLEDNEYGFGNQTRDQNFQYGVNITGAGPVRNTAEEPRFDRFHHRDKGPLRYDTNRIYFDQEVKTRHKNPCYYSDEPARLEDLEADRAELIRKLDELRDTLTRSCDLTENPKEKRLSPTRNDPHHIGLNHHTASVQRGPYLISPGGQESALYPNSSSYSSNSKHSYPHQSPSRCSHFPHHQQLYCVDVNHDHHFLLQPREVIAFKPDAPSSCVHCCGSNNISYDNNNRHLRENVDDPSVFCNRRSGYDYYHVNPVKSEYHSCGSSTLDSSCQSSSSPSLGKKFVMPKKSGGRLWRPIAGGAPFITCCNCFELLKLDKKHISLAKIQQKVKCGSCSSIILFEHGGNGLVSSVSERIRKVPVEIDEDCAMKEDSNKTTSPNRSDHRFSPKEENSCSFESEDEKTVENTLSSPIHDFVSSELQHLTAESESTANLDSFSQEISGNNFSDRVDEQRVQTSDSVKGAVLDESRQKPSEVEEFECTRATEINVCLSELPNSSISHESESTSRGGSNSKGISSSSFGDFTNPNEISESTRPPVFVNGHLIPDHEVKKAEKLAGPIQPGEYWYDIVAGFWGVMGHPCLGIIMPNIEEFDYPMPKNCAAGNTGVYVNGRELYEKDFDLLTGRGLPHTRNRSYIIDMSGNVVNEQTGQELDSLGKLAPTVEKAGHGFGMKVPKFIARLQS